jgi:hypothetical protein
MAEGDAALIKYLDNSKSAEPHDWALKRSCAMAIGNLSSTQVNQITIGYSDAVTWLLRLLVDCNDPLVLEASGISNYLSCHTIYSFYILQHWP